MCLGCIGERVAKSWAELTAGTGTDPRDELVWFDTEIMTPMPVACLNITYTAVCAHHLLPFFGKVDLAYMAPPYWVAGASKMSRVVNSLARRITLQEEISAGIVQAFATVLEPFGGVPIVVHVAGTHLCMMARGVKQPDATLITENCWDSDPKLSNVNQLWATLARAQARGF